MVGTSNGNGTSVSGTDFKKLFFTPIVPFNEDDTIDYDSYRQFIRRFMKDEYLKEGIAIIANPEAGELFTLDREERRNIVKICVEEAAGRCPVVAGVVHVHTKGYIETAKDAQELGATGLFIFPPIGAGDIVAIWDSDKYPEVFSDIIKDVTAAVDLPCIIHPVGRYSIPFGQGLPLKTTKAILDECPNVIGWKMTYNFDGYRKIARFLQNYERPVAILAAVGHYMHENHADRMFDGTSSGAWNYALEPMMEHLKLWRKGDWKAATDLWEGGLAQLHQCIFEDIGRLHVKYKTAVWLRGIIASPVMRAPMPKPRLAEIEEVKAALKGAGLKVLSDEEIQKTITAMNITL